MIHSTAAIYSIKNAKNNKRYIGSSNYPLTRMGKHKEQLRANTHANTKLQLAWNVWGESEFHFSVVKEVPQLLLENENAHEDRLLREEQRYIDFYDSVNSGYNMINAVGPDD